RIYNLCAGLPFSRDRRNVEFAKKIQQGWRRHECFHVHCCFTPETFNINGSFRVHVHAVGALAPTCAAEDSRKTDAPDSQRALDENNNCRSNRNTQDGMYHNRVKRRLERGRRTYACGAKADTRGPSGPIYDLHYGPRIMWYMEAELFTA
ncbi:unnamed protein product, partial [Ectocarpus sp. 12 AP-2014]